MRIVMLDLDSCPSLLFCCCGSDGFELIHSLSLHFVLAFVGSRAKAHGDGDGDGSNGI